MTLREIADASHTSGSAVSVVLHGAKSGTRVSKAKRIAILREAKRLGYIDRKGINSTRLLQSYGIAVINCAPFDECDNYFHELLGGILEQASKSKLNVYIYTGGTDEEALSDFLSSGHRGIILSSVGHFDPMSQIAAEPTAVVAIGEPIDGIPSVIINDYTGGRKVGAESVSLLESMISGEKVPTQEGGAGLMNTSS